MRASTGIGTEGASTGAAKAAPERRRRVASAAVALALLAALTAAVAVGGAQGQEPAPDQGSAGEAGAPEPGGDPGSAGTDQARDEGSKADRRRSSNRDRADRRRGRGRDDAASTAPSGSPTALFERFFADIADALETDPLADGEVERYLSDHTALVEVDDPAARGELRAERMKAQAALDEQAEAEGLEAEALPDELLPEAGQPTALAISTLPLRARARSGKKRPVDLDLAARGGGFEPRVPIVAAKLPARLGQGIALPDSEIRIGFPGLDGGAEAERVGERALIYPDAEADADVLAAPVATGVETFAQLRSPDSPEELRLRLSLPADASLSEAGGGIEVAANDGEPIAFVHPPYALDADGEEVEVEMRAEGADVVLTVAHRDADLAYPVLVDPLVETYEWSAPSQAGLTDWAPSQNSPAYVLRTDCNAGQGWGCYGAPSLDRGLYVYARANQAFAGGRFGRWSYLVPRYPDSGTTYVDRADFAPLEFRKRGDANNNPRLRLRILDPDVGVVDNGLFTSTETIQTGSATLNPPATGTGRDGKQVDFELFVPNAASNFQLSQRREAYVGGAVITLTDLEFPGVSETHDGLPEGWVEDASASVEATGTDPGLGVKELRLRVGDFHGNEVLDTRVHPCAGGASDPCPTEWSQSFDYSTEEMGEGLVQVEVNATDAGGRTSTSTEVIPIDRTPPQLELSGRLLDGEGSPDLAIEATDRGPEGNLFARARSGVAELEVLIDGEQAYFASQPCDEFLGSCPMSRNLSLEDLGIDPWEVSEIEIEVIATDQLGHEARESFTTDLGAQNPRVERITHEVREPVEDPEDPDSEELEEPKSTLGWTSDAEVTTRLFARDGRKNPLEGGEEGVAEIGLHLPDTVDEDEDPVPGETTIEPVDCTGERGCPAYAGRGFEWSTEEMPEGAYEAIARARSGDGQFSRPETFDVKVDRTVPVIDEASSELVGASGQNLVFEVTVAARDGDPEASEPSEVRAGVRSIELLVAGKRRGYATQRCAEGSCPMTHTFRYQPSREEASDQLEVSVVVSDQAGNEATEELATPPGAGAELQSAASAHGLERYFHYDSIETGLAGLHTNLATSNAVWHKVPVVNPGRGLSSVANLTYNAHDYPVSELLGDLAPAASNVLGTLGVGYTEAGPGFSLGISGLTRINEPLGGVATASLGSSPSLEPVTNPEAIFLTDATGTRHRFDLTQPFVWEGPPGVDLHLRAYSLSELYPLNPEITNAELTIPENLAKLYAATRPDGVTHYFDGYGFQRSISDRNGNELRFHYKLVNPLSFQRCDGPGQLNVVVPTVCEPRLDEVVDPAGVSELDSEGAAPAERVLKVDYWDADDGRSLTDGDWGRIQSITDHAGRELRFSYSPAGRLTSLSEAAGTSVERTTQFAYDNPGLPQIGGVNLGPLLDSLGIPRISPFHPQLTEVTDPRGNPTEIDYSQPPLDLNFVLDLIGQLASVDVSNLLDIELLDRPVREVTNRRGNSRDYAFQPVERTARVTDARGVGSEYELDHRARLRSMSECVATDPAECSDPEAEPAERTTELAWSQDNRVLRLAEAAGSADQAITHYSYNENGALTALRDPLGRLTELEYADGPGTQLSELAFFGIDDSQGEFVSDLAAIRRPAGNEWSFETDEAGNVTKQTDPLGAEARFDYDAHGQVTASVDEVGNETTYPSYDPNGLATEVIAPRGNAAGGDPAQNRWLYLYDEVGNLRQAVDPRGAASQPDGPLEALLPGDTPYVTSLAYDELDRLTEEMVPKRSSEAGLALAERFIERDYAYDPNDNPIERTDGTGATFTSEFTPMDRPEAEVAPGLTPGGEPRSERAEYAYDAEEGLVGVVAPRGTASATDGDFETRFILDSLGRRVASARTTGATGPAAQVLTAHGFDLRDNELRVIDPNRNRAAERTPEEAAAAAADPASEDPEAELRLRRSFDRADQLLTEVTDPSELALRRTYAYDANGNLIQEVGPRGFEPGAEAADFATHYDYDARDQLTALTDAVGSRTEYAYRADGLLEAETAPRGTATPAIDGDHTVSYDYDPNGELASRSIPWTEGQYGPDPQDLVVSYERDAVGNPVGITDARGNAFSSAFLDSGELLTTERPSWWGLEWASGHQSPDAGRSYPQTGGSGMEADLAVPAGGPRVAERGESGAPGAGGGEEIRPPSLPDAPALGDFGDTEREGLRHQLPAAGATVLDYDGELRITRVASGAGGASERFGIVYDPQGRIARKRWPLDEERTVRHDFAYDRNGNLSRFEDGEGHATTFAYDALDRRTSEEAPGSRPAPGEPVNRELTEWGYDPNGNLRRRVAPRGNPTPEPPGELPDGTHVFRFAYDPADRLIREENPASEVYRYELDAAGNVTSELAPGVATSTDPADDLVRPEARFAYDPADRMTRLTEAAGSPAERRTRFAYDEAGNRVLVDEPGARDSDGDLHRRITRTTFDGRDLPWKVTAAADTPQRHTRITEFDPNGNLRRTVNPKGVDGHGPSAEPEVADPGTDQGASDAARHATVGTYDEHGLLRERHLPWADEAPGGAADESDPNGIDQIAENQKRYLQAFDYNPRGLLITAFAPHRASDEERSATSYTYYETDWVASATEPKIVDSELPDDFRVRQKSLLYDYDRRGLQTVWRTRVAKSETDPSDLAPARRVRSSYHPSGLIEAREGRLDFSPGSDTATRAYEYYYNRNRSLVATVDHRWIFSPYGPALRRTSIARDPAERERHTEEAWASGRDTTLAHDEQGNVTRRRLDVSDPEDDQSGRRHRFAYDELSRETEMLVRGDGPERQMTTDYFPSGDAQERTKPNGTTETYRWRADGLAERKVRDPEQGATETQSYAYDRNLNRTRDEKGSHTYNARDQLVLWDPAKQGESYVSYRLNGSGQLLAQLDADSDSDDDADVTYTYVGDSENGERLKEVVTEYPTETPTLRQTYFHDDLGNVVRIQNQSESGGVFPPAADPPDNPCADANWTDSSSSYFCFDEFSRQVTSKAPGSDDPDLVVYDGLDRRDFRATDDGSPGEFAYIGTSPMLSREKRKNGDTATYDYNSRGERQGQRHRPEGGGTPTYRAYASDAQGSVVGLEGAQGQLPEGRTYDYDPYGALQAPDPSSEDDAEEQLAPAAQENPFRFQGHYYDSGVKTYDMQARSYLPEAGRFLSEDRFQAAGADLQLQTDPLTQNRYAFAGGNPVTQIEFDGHWACGPGNHDGCSGAGAREAMARDREARKRRGATVYPIEAPQGGWGGSAQQEVEQEVEQRVELTGARIQNVENAVDAASEEHLGCTADECSAAELAQIRLMVWADLSAATEGWGSDELNAGLAFDRTTSGIARDGTPSLLRGVPPDKVDIAIETASLICGAGKLGCAFAARGLLHGGKALVKLTKKLWPFGGKAARVGDDVPGLSSNSYRDITERRSIRNVGTDASHTDFAGNLRAGGWTSRRSKNGAVEIFEQDGARYVLRNKADSYSGWTADYTPRGSQGPTLKIRLGYP